MYTSTNITVSSKDVAAFKTHSYKEISPGRDMLGGYMRLDDNSPNTITLSFDDKASCEGLIAKLQELSDKLSEA